MVHPRTILTTTRIPAESPVKFVRAGIQIKGFRAPVRYSRHRVQQHVVHCKIKTVPIAGVGSRVYLPIKNQLGRPFNSGGKGSIRAVRHRAGFQRRAALSRTIQFTGPQDFGGGPGEITIIQGRAHFIGVWRRSQTDNQVYSACGKHHDIHHGVLGYHLADRYRSVVRFRYRARNQSGADKSIRSSNLGHTGKIRHRNEHLLSLRLTLTFAFRLSFPLN